MPCTTVLVGKKASNDNSTMIARTDDGFFDTKKVVVIEPDKQPKKYKCVNSHLTIELKEKAMRYTAAPSVDKKNGIWAATGINEAGVGMTATETITSNPRVLSADPLVKYEKAKGKKKEVIGGIGEEDILVLVLPYIKTAREGVERLAKLLEKYGTYESNGIAFNDDNEIWWMETIGGHHYMAKRVPDDVCVIAPNQFGMDSFDLKDAFGDKKAHLCSKDLKEFIKENNLDLNQNGKFNPRDVFGSHTDMDHIYNTPRAWFMGRYITPFSHKWDGPDAEYTPESDNIPWALVPDRKLALEDVRYLLSGHFQGTDFDPYKNKDTGKRGMYRSIGINRTGVTSICQIRDKMPKEIRGVEWIAFASTTFDGFLPIYTCVPKLPSYISNVTLDASTENLYWASCFIGTLADSNFAACGQIIERYQDAMMIEGRKALLEYDKKMLKTKDYELAIEANDKICAKAKELTQDTLNKVMHQAQLHMKNGYNRADN